MHDSGEFSCEVTGFYVYEGFVIPTEVARRALASVGWVTPGALVPHVYALDFTRYVRALVGSGWLATRIPGQIGRLARVVACARAPRDGTLQFKDALDEIALRVRPQTARV